MPKGRKIFETGGQNGLKKCPCGYSFTGDERRRNKAFQLHAKKCEVAKNVVRQDDYHLPNQAYTSSTDVEVFANLVGAQYGDRA